MFSYWERTTWLDASDYIVIGSGIVGLNAALHLKSLKPNAKITVLERGTLPDGASTKNAGFACFGSLSEIAADIEHSGWDAALDLVCKRYKGLCLLRKMLGDTAIEYEALGGFELFRHSDAPIHQQALSLMDPLNKALSDITANPQVYKHNHRLIHEMGFKNVLNLIENSAEGQINPGKMIRRLLSRAAEADIAVLFGIQVLHIHETVSGVELETSVGAMKALNVLVATNGFASQLLPQLEVKPARAQVLITQPIENLKVKGSFHMDEGYLYFRNVGNRILLGGGRNLAFETETTVSHETTDTIQHHLEDLLQTVIIPEQPFVVEQRWAGTMGLGSNKKPIVERVSPHVFCAVRMGGMGIALGSLTGHEAAELMNE
ncbi:MAG: NAD(P)/FAD-dependent oxidoreductase [Bacteroidia bacterium]|jgi:glycine/D-amino acid oxidase-like deaminating enzyme